MNDSRNLVPKITSLRVPPDVKQWIMEQARKNNRSQTGEVIFRLRQAMEAEQRECSQ